MAFENRIYREWIGTDSLGLVRQLGLDPDLLAEARAREMLSRGQEGIDIGEVGRMLGQMPPDREPDLGVAHTDTEIWVLRGLHEIYNRRMLGQIRILYAANAQWHGPLMKELSGRAAIIHQTLGLLGTLPDCAWVPQHVCSVPSEEGGEKIAIRWVMEGHHLGYGMLGKPTGHRVFMLGFTHLHVLDERITEEWTVYDGLAMLTQVKLGALASA